MKRLLSILLVAAMLASMVLPAAAAEEPEITVGLPKTLEASTWCSYTAEDEKTGTEWTYFNWVDGVTMTGSVNGDLMENVTVNMFLSRVCETFFPTYGDTFWRVTDGQSVQTPWQVGNTYTVTMSCYCYSDDGKEEMTVWSDTMDVHVYDRPVSVEITSPITVSTACGKLEEDTETQQEYIHYDWVDNANPISAVINGVEYKNIPFRALLSAFYEQYGEEVHFGIADTQHTTPWTVGGTYTCTLWLITSGITSNTVWEGQVNVTLVAPTVDMQVTSDMEFDELIGDRIEENDTTYLRYDTLMHGRLDVTVDGTAYTDITLEELGEALMEEYGYVWFSISSNNRTDHDAFEQTAENPWEAGDEFIVTLTATLEDTGEVIYDNYLTIKVCETKIASVSIAPITYYVYQNSGDPEFTVTYKDGSTGTVDYLSYTYEGSWPKEPGSYTMNFTVLGQFQLTVPVTVLETPHSGSLGDTVNWKYDPATETLTLSGTGAATIDYLRPWTQLYIALHPKHAVVEEGIEILPEGIFYNSIYLEDVSLPSTLKEIPYALIGFNGPTAGTSFEEYYGIVPGVTSIVIPEGITSLTGTPFFQCWGISDFYLPSTIEEVDLDALCHVAYLRADMGLPALETTIHYAGTEAQWANIKKVIGTTRLEFGIEMSEEELEALFATFTISFEPKTVTVPDSSVEITEGEDVVIDVTGNDKEATGVIISPETVDKIADAAVSVDIKLPDATVSFDKTAVGSISQQAGTSSVTIVATEVTDAALNADQKTALENRDVLIYLSLEAHAGNTKITDFGGGKVTVSVPFELPADKTGSDYYVAYIAEDGTVTAMPTTYAAGSLSFETTHFSSYVVLEKGRIQPDAIEGEYAEEINLWLKIFVPDSFKEEGAYLTMTKQGGFGVETVTVKGSELGNADAKGRYLLKMGIASGEMTSKVTYEFYDADGNKMNIVTSSGNNMGDAATFSLLNYAKSMLRSGTDAQKKMVAAMLTYGGYAQKYFNVDAENPAYNLLTQMGMAVPSLDGVTADLITDRTIVADGGNGIKATGMQAFLDSAIYLRVYFSLAEGADIDDYKFVLTYAKPDGTVDTMELEAGYEAGKNRYYADIEDIPAAYLDYMYNITVTNTKTNATYSVTTSVMVWMRNALNSATDENHKNLLKAIYLYNQAANEFFGK